MQAEEIVIALNGKGRYPRWRAKCPVHRSRGLTLAIKAGHDRVSITCHAGCHSDEVLAAIGLKWQDTLYNRDANPEAWRAARRVREEEDRREANKRKIVRLALRYASLWKAVTMGLSHLEESPLFDEALENLILFESVADAYEVPAVRGRGVPIWHGPISSKWVGKAIAEAIRKGTAH